MIEVLKQALDALEKVKRRAVVMGSTGDYREGQLDALKAVSEDVKPAIASLQQAITELESQEPVAWKHDCAALLQNNIELWVDGCPHCGKPRTVHPPQRTWVGLTDDEHCDIWYKESLDWMEYGKAIEAKLKQKNGFSEEKNT